MNCLCYVNLCDSLALLTMSGIGTQACMSATEIAVLTHVVRLVVRQYCSLLDVESTCALLRETHTCADMYNAAAYVLTLASMLLYEVL